MWLNKNHSVSSADVVSRAPQFIFIYIQKILVAQTSKMEHHYFIIEISDCQLGRKISDSIWWEIEMETETVQTNEK